MDYMLLARPEGVKLDIKQSSYKKLGKFYEQMAKQKFIQFKHGKEKKGQQGSTISRIMYENEQLKNFVPTIQRMGQKEVEAKEQTVNSNSIKTAKLKISKSLTVENVYKVNEELLNELNFKKVDYMKDID